MATADRTPVIVGVGLSPGPARPDLVAVDHHRIALFEALADAGLERSDIDGYFAPGGSPAAPGNLNDEAMAMTEYLKLRPSFIDSTNAAGASSIVHLQHAFAAIQSGMCDVAAITYGSDLYSKTGRSLGTGVKPGFDGVNKAYSEILEFPYGSTTVAGYAMIAQRYLHVYGATPEQLAAVAVTMRSHAAGNPYAMYREPITVEDVLSSPLIADPLHRLDCCVVSDGGGAVLVTTAERARELPVEPIYIRGAAAGQTHWRISQMPDLLNTAATDAGARAFAMAGMSPSDIDVLQLYDSFTITVLRLLEDLGFCARGEAAPIAAAGELKAGGRFPTNTDGGGLSALHPGRRGMFLIVEAVRQLRGTAIANQIADCSNALVAGSGGFMSAIGVAILSNARS